MREECPINLSENSAFGNTLIVGAGPAAIQIAVNLSKGWSNKIGLLNRKGKHAEKIMQELKENGYMLSANVIEGKHDTFLGQVKLTHFYPDFEKLDDFWDTVILCTPSDSYGEVVSMLELHLLPSVKTIILISPSIGSHLIVRGKLKDLKEKIEIINFSTYYAATKFDPKSANNTTVLTKAIKKKIYISSNKKNRLTVSYAQRFIESLGITCCIDNHPMETESKNITTYVHPPLFINSFSLNEILNTKPSTKFMYKLYPEGPITQHVITNMVQLWKEISTLMHSFSVKPINLLQFLNDDNYPVHSITISRDDIDDFPNLDQVKQEYLLYIRYTALLIDPFSVPNKTGKYFEFSAVPYKQIYQNQDGKWIIPRIPFEDYKKLKLIYEIANRMNVAMPITLGFLQLFETRINDFIKTYGRQNIHEDILGNRIKNEVDIIFDELDVKI